MSASLLHVTRAKTRNPGLDRVRHFLETAKLRFQFRRANPRCLVCGALCDRPIRYPQHGYTCSEQCAAEYQLLQAW